LLPRRPDGALVAVADEKREEPDSALNMGLLQIACGRRLWSPDIRAPHDGANLSEKAGAVLFAIARFYSRLWFV